ncbi:MAG TPA: isoprenylcysteine carboxylmethyltransferase family protein [Pseudogracilibacillus sp.]|nr:isoprenylcysteine carboxylmethyltransferase family protein [Pseudogracilibacillus sp.]
MTFFIIFIIFLLLQRLFELYIAKRNEKWMLERGAVEFGQVHYKWFVLMHILFFFSIITEVVFQSFQQEINISWIFVWLFIMMQLARIWCIGSLGRFWNTKIIVLENVILIKKGPYRWVRHPNYIIVLIELFVIPFMFHAYFTAIIFPTLHILLLMVRIPEEEKALGKNLY